MTKYFLKVKVQQTIVVLLLALFIKPTYYSLPIGGGSEPSAVKHQAEKAAATKEE